MTGAPAITEELHARQAVAMAQVINGFVVGVNIVDPGGGYVSDPWIRLVDATGFGANARAIVKNGQVTEIVIDDVGSDYTSNTLVCIGPPQSLIEYALGERLVEVQEQGEARTFSFHRRRNWNEIGLQYVVETSPNLENWSPMQGEAVIKTVDDTWEQVSLEAENSALELYVRVKVSAQNQPLP